MFMHKSKKGFTIVELVIVIAVIAILAAVLIPTFSNLVKKANMSADQQAVRQMNTLLAAEEATGKPETFANAINALLASKVSMKNYKALVSDMSFYWVKALNRVVYVDKNMTVTYPADLTETTYNMADGWFALSGEVATDAKWEEKITENKLTVTDGSTFVAFMNAVVAGDLTAETVTTVEITEDIDLKGAEANFGRFVGKDLTIKGTGDETPKIYNVRNGASSFVSTENVGNIPTTYGYGLFGQIGGNDGSGRIDENLISNVTIDNIEFANVSINATPATGAESTSGAAIIVGKLCAGSTLTLKDVTIRDSYVNVAKKAGAVTGYVESGTTINVTGDTGLVIDNVQVAAGKECSAVLGFVQSGHYNLGNTTINISKDKVSITNVTVSKDASYGITGNEVYDTTSHYWYAASGAGKVAKNFN